MSHNNRSPSDYNLFLAEKFRNGMTMGQAQAAWKLHKCEAEREATRLKKQLEFEKNKKARTIQKQWREAISNPSFKFCKNRLQLEFSSMA